MGHIYQMVSTLENILSSESADLGLRLRRRLHDFLGRTLLLGTEASHLGSGRDVRPRQQELRDSLFASQYEHV